MRIVYVVFVWALFVSADEVKLPKSNGKVVGLIGKAYVLVGGVKSELKYKQKIFPDSKVITEPDSKVKIILDDGTEIFIGGGSDVDFQKVKFNFTNKIDNEIKIDINSGGLKFLTGAIGNLNKERVILKTKTATMGIRGTELYIYDENNATNIGCTSGLVVAQASTSGAEALVAKGKMTSASSTGDEMKIEVLDFSKFGDLDPLYIQLGSVKTESIPEKIDLDELYGKDRMAGIRQLGYAKLYLYHTQGKLQIITRPRVRANANAELALVRQTLKDAHIAMY